MASCFNEPGERGCRQDETGASIGWLGFYRVFKVTHVVSNASRLCVAMSCVAMFCVTMFCVTMFCVEGMRVRLGARPGSLPSPARRAGTEVMYNTQGQRPDSLPADHNFFRESKIR